MKQILQLIVTSILLTSVNGGKCSRLYPNTEVRSDLTISKGGVHVTPTPPLVSSAGLVYFKSYAAGTPKQCHISAFSQDFTELWSVRT